MLTKPLWANSRQAQRTYGCRPWWRLKQIGTMRETRSANWIWQLCTKFSYCWSSVGWGLLQSTLSRPEWSQRRCSHPLTECTALLSSITSLKLSMSNV